MKQGQFNVLVWIAALVFAVIVAPVEAVPIRDGHDNSGFQVRSISEHV